MPFYPACVPQDSRAGFYRPSAEQLHSRPERKLHKRLLGLSRLDQLIWNAAFLGKELGQSGIKLAGWMLRTVNVFPKLMMSYEDTFDVVQYDYSY